MAAYEPASLKDTNGEPLYQFGLISDRWKEMPSVDVNINVNFQSSTSDDIAKINKITNGFSLGFMWKSRSDLQFPFKVEAHIFSRSFRNLRQHCCPDSIVDLQGNLYSLMFWDFPINQIEYEGNPLRNSYRFTFTNDRNGPSFLLSKNPGDIPSNSTKKIVKLWGCYNCSCILETKKNERIEFGSFGLGSLFMPGLSPCLAQESEANNSIYIVGYYPMDAGFYSENFALKTESLNYSTYIVCFDKQNFNLQGDKFRADNNSTKFNHSFQEGGKSQNLLMTNWSMSPQIQAAVVNNKIFIFSSYAPNTFNIKPPTSKKNMAFELIGNFLKLPYFNTSQSDLNIIVSGISPRILFRGDKIHFMYKPCYYYTHNSIENIRKYGKIWATLNNTEPNTSSSIILGSTFLNSCSEDRYCGSFFKRTNFVVSHLFKPWKEDFCLIEHKGEVILCALGFKNNASNDGGEISDLTAARGWAYPNTSWDPSNYACILYSTKLNGSTLEYNSDLHTYPANVIYVTNFQIAPYVSVYSTISTYNYNALYSSTQRIVPYTTASGKNFIIYAYCCPGKKPQLYLGFAPYFVDDDGHVHLQTKFEFRDKEDQSFGDFTSCARIITMDLKNGHLWITFMNADDTEYHYFHILAKDLVRE